jgi:hypothetical protein
MSRPRRAHSLSAYERWCEPAVWLGSSSSLKLRHPREKAVITEVYGTIHHRPVVKGCAVSSSKPRKKRVFHQIAVKRV